MPRRIPREMVRAHAAHPPPRRRTPPPPRRCAVYFGLRVPITLTHASFTTALYDGYAKVSAAWDRQTNPERCAVEPPAGARAPETTQRTRHRRRYDGARCDYPDGTLSAGFYKPRLLFAVWACAVLNCILCVFLAWLCWSYAAELDASVEAGEAARLLGLEARARPSPRHAGAD